MVSGIQIVGAIFGLLVSYFTFLHWKRREFTFREFLGWEAIWVGFIAATLFPNSFSIFLGNLGVLRLLDLFSIIGFILVLSITFYTYVGLDRLRKKLEKAIRDLALSGLSQPLTPEAPQGAPKPAAKKARRR